MSVRAETLQEEKRFWNSKRVAKLFRWILGIIFIYSSLDKLQHPVDFAQAVVNYQILPVIFVNLVAIILPWLELVCGILLVIGIYKRGSLLIINVLLTVFFAAIAVTLFRGLEIGCGCFSVSNGEDTIGVSYLLRDSVLIGMGIFAYLKES